MLYDFLDQYEDRFQEPFPNMVYQGEGEEKMIEYIKECLSKNKPISTLHPIDYSDGKCY